MGQLSQESGVRYIMPQMIILGIETSCDETAISVVEAKGDLQNLSFKVLGSAIQSQIKMHAEFGGVVPNLAKREHIKNLPIVYKEALEKSGLSEDKLGMIAVTVGPGLEPALWTGIKFAEELGKRCGLPVIPTNHMIGHIASVLINKTEEFSISNFQFSNRKLEFPTVALLISGGHTELVFMKSWVEREKIGETQDDAVGEAFDKVARMLGLPYPGGPGISKLAEEARAKNIYLETKFPRPMIHSKNFNFSFSGLKTAVLYYLKKKISQKQQSLEQTGYFSTEKSPPSHASRAPKVALENVASSSPLLHLGEGLGGEVVIAVAREFEDAVIETLISKTKAAIEKYSPKTLIIGGGVIANKALRENFLKLSKNYSGMKILIPEKSLTTDNATMIAAAGYIEYLRNNKPNRKLKAQGNLDIVS